MSYWEQVTGNVMGWRPIGERTASSEPPDYPHHHHHHHPAVSTLNVFCLELSPSTPPLRLSICKQCESDEYLPSEPLSHLGSYSSVRWPNPHQKDQAPACPHLSPSVLSFASVSLSLSPLFFLSLVRVPAAHSGSHLVFLICFYMSPRTLARSLSRSVTCSLARPHPLPLLVCLRSTTHTHTHTHRTHKQC